MPRRASSAPLEPQRGVGVPVAALQTEAATGPLIIKSVAEVIAALQCQLEISEHENTQRRELIVKLKEHFPDHPTMPSPNRRTGRPPIDPNDKKRAKNAAKQRRHRARLRAQAATAAEGKPSQTDSDDVIQKAAAEPKPQKPSKAIEFQQWRERRNDAPVLDNSLVAS